MRSPYLALGLVIGCQSQKTVGPPNTPPPDPPAHPEESGRRKGGGLLPSGCKWAIDEPFINGDFPITREADRFFEGLERRLRKEHDRYCTTSCGEPNDTSCPHGFPPRDDTRSLSCRAFRIDASVISVGCLESKPAGAASAMTFHGLNIRADGPVVRPFDLESLFAPSSDWPGALARGLTAHDKLHRDWTRIVSLTTPPSKSPAFFHANVTPSAVVLTMMEGVDSSAMRGMRGERLEVPFTELADVLAR